MISVRLLYALCKESIAEFTLSSSAAAFLALTMLSASSFPNLLSVSIPASVKIVFAYFFETLSMTRPSVSALSIKSQFKSAPISLSAEVIDMIEDSISEDDTFTPVNVLYAS